MTPLPLILEAADVGRRVDAAGLASPTADWRDAAETMLVTLPAWVERAGLAASEGIHWLWVEPAADGPADVAASQAVLDAPRGRYRIDTIDPETGETVAREIATAGPLVIGLPHRGAAVLLRIEAIEGT